MFERNHIDEAMRLGGSRITRVLIIDDDPSVGAAIRLTLTRHGTQAVHALTTHSGLRAFGSTDFDLVIVDLFMLEMKGIEIIGKLRDLAPTVSILAIFGFRFRKSMDAGPDFLGIAEKGGATAVLPKPFTPGQFTATIEAILKDQLPMLIVSKSTTTRVIAMGPR
jgi:DNA-binding response OmpR family regulator